MLPPSLTRSLGVYPFDRLSRTGENCPPNTIPAANATLNNVRIVRFNILTPYLIWIQKIDLISHWDKHVKTWFSQTRLSCVYVAGFILLMIALTRSVDDDANNVEEQSCLDFV